MSVMHSATGSNALSTGERLRLVTILLWHKTLRGCSILVKMLKHCHSTRSLQKPSVQVFGDIETDSLSLPDISNENNNENEDIIKVYCDESLGVYYKSLLIKPETKVRDVVLKMMQKYQLLHRDPNLFFLTLELSDDNALQEGLTKKTLVLDMDNRLMEFSSCHTWFTCRFVLRVKKGKEVKVVIEMLEQEKEETLMISKETAAETMIRMILQLIGLHRDECGNYCLYEESLSRRYQRKMGRKEKPWKILQQWKEEEEEEGDFRFKMRRNLDDAKQRLYYIPMHE